MTTGCPSGSIREVREKSSAAVVDQIEDDVESAHIVGVGHIRVFRVGGKIEEPNDAFGIEAGGGCIAEVTLIRGIHGNEPIETFKVRGSQFPRALHGDVEASFTGDGDGACVWRLSSMPPSGPTGVHEEARGQVLISDLGDKNALGERRAADVSEADEKDGGAIHGVSRL